jgi:hypothetical protein
MGGAGRNAVGRSGALYRVAVTRPQRSDKRDAPSRRSHAARS